MADVYVMYPLPDRERADEVASALAACGWDVRIPDDFIERDQNELRTSRCIVALWSKRSDPLPAYVRSELWAARQRRVLIPVFLDDVEPPPGFRPTDSYEDRYGSWPNGIGEYREISLVGWRGNRKSEGFTHLKDRVKRFAGDPPPPARAASKRSKRTSPREAKPQPLAPAPSPVEPPLQTAPSQRLFLCYRREDSQGETGRLHDRLTSAFGPEAVFMDVDDVPFGVDFVDHVNEQLAGTSLVLVVIGRLWSTAVDKKGRRRLDLAHDSVRTEIAEALNRKIPIIPVLLHGVSMPDPEDLPENIRVLARRNAIDLTHKRWDVDVEQLLAAIKRLFQRAGSPPT